jgi:hypothetical protein
MQKKMKVMGIPTKSRFMEIKIYMQLSLLNDEGENRLNIHAQFGTNLSGYIYISYLPYPT